MEKNDKKKKFSLKDLEIDSFVTSLSEEEQKEILGGHPPFDPTKCPVHCKQEMIEI